MDQLPTEIVVRLFDYLPESDKRKLSVTCLLFCEIFHGFCTLLPFKVELDRFDGFCQQMFQLRAFWGEEYFTANQKYFDIFGPDPSILVTVNNSHTFPIAFREKPSSDNTLHPNLNSIRKFKIKIVSTHNCKLKFTNFHSTIYYVDGCSLSDIHSALHEPCKLCLSIKKYERRYFTLKNFHS